MHLLYVSKLICECKDTVYKEFKFNKKRGIIRAKHGIKRTSVAYKGVFATILQQ